MKLIRVVFIFAILVLTGCAGKSVSVEFPINHPANPQALETEFTPPQNPFRTDVAGMEGEPERDSMMKHKTHNENGKPHFGHGMETDKENGADSESTMKPDHRDGHHQHKGYSQ